MVARILHCLRRIKWSLRSTSHIQVLLLTTMPLVVELERAVWRGFDLATKWQQSVYKWKQSESHCIKSCLSISLVTQPMLQCQPNPMELRSMDSYIQFLCRFQKCKRKVLPPSFSCENPYYYVQKSILNALQHCLIKMLLFLTIK